MEYSTQELPHECIEAGEVGRNFVTRNARFRSAVCQHFNLEWVSVGGTGNCFFASVVAALRAEGILDSNVDFTPHQLRLNLVEYFRLCFGSTQPLCERVVIEIEAEQHEPLLCSTHARIHGERLNGFVPGSTERYLDAVANNGVWPQGFHWFRGVSYLYHVRVAVIIFGNEIVRFFGQGDKVIYLYKFDAETHFDPLISLRDHPAHVISSSYSNSNNDDNSLPATAAAVAPGKCSPSPHESVHFLTQSKCAALPTMTTTTLSPPQQLQ